MLTFDSGQSIKFKSTTAKELNRIYDQMAIMAEFDEWFDPKEDLEVVSLDEISKEQYDDYTDYMNDGIERG